ncbi:hypothetical protein H8D91_00620 [archaeon]|nr:hypothetical protein [archaeon]
MVTRKESTRIFMDGIIELGQRKIEETVYRKKSTEAFIEGVITTGQKRMEEIQRLYLLPAQVYALRR